MPLKIDIDRIIRLEIDWLHSKEDEAATIIHCSYTASGIYHSGGWLSIWPTTYLVFDKGSERLQLLHAINIPVAPERKHFKREGETLPFTLIFPRIPEHWPVFHLHESAGSGTGFKVNHIKRNESGIYRLKM